MMRGAFAFTSLCVLVACGVPDGGGKIRDVSIRNEAVRIFMTDGARCVVPFETGAPVSIAGVTEDCGYALTYSVTLSDTRRNPARFILEELLSAVGGDNLLAPRAIVRIEDTDGRERVFISPADVN